MRRLALFTLLLLFTALSAACSSATLPQLGQSTQKDYSNNGPALLVPAAAPTAAPAAPPVPAQGGSVKSTTDSGLPQAVDQAATDRMVVYSGNLSLQVQDTEATMGKIADLLKANQGYISNRALDRDAQGQLRGSITIRVPAGSLDAVLAQIKALGIKTLHEDAQSSDVTQQYVDLDARRKNLEAYEVELTQLLDTVRQTSGKASDLLAVYNQLTEVRGQIEQIKGQQNYLQNTSALATYTIQFVPLEQVPVVEEGWSPVTTARQALHALVQSLQGLADIGIFALLYVIPVLVIIALPFILIFMVVRRAWRRRLPKSAATA